VWANGSNAPAGQQQTSRRSLLAASLLASLVLESSLSQPAEAVQGLTAGRLPGPKTKSIIGLYTMGRGPNLLLTAFLEV